MHTRTTSFLVARNKQWFENAETCKAVTADDGPTANYDPISNTDSKDLLFRQEDLHRQAGMDRHLSYSKPCLNQPFSYTMDK